MQSKRCNLINEIRKYACIEISNVKTGTQFNDTIRTEHGRKLVTLSNLSEAHQIDNLLPFVYDNVSIPHTAGAEDRTNSCPTRPAKWVTLYCTRVHKYVDRM